MSNITWEDLKEVDWGNSPLYGNHVPLYWLCSNSPSMAYDLCDNPKDLVSVMIHFLPKKEVIYNLYYTLRKMIEECASPGAKKLWKEIGHWIVDSKHQDEVWALEGTGIQGSCGIETWNASVCVSELACAIRAEEETLSWLHACVETASRLYDPSEMCIVIRSICSWNQLELSKGEKEHE